MFRSIILHKSRQKSWSKNQECGMINAWNENGNIDGDAYWVLSIRTIYDENGLESKKFPKKLGNGCKYEHSCRFSTRSHY